MTASRIIFKQSLDRLPCFGQGRIIFIANILSLFFGNENETNELRREVGALESYGGRLIPILHLLYRSDGHLLVLEKPPDAALVGYFKSLGLKLPEIEVLPHDFYQKYPRHADLFSVFLKRLRTDPAAAVHGYVTDPILEDLADRIHKKTLSTLEGCRNGNNKLLLHRYLKEKGLLTFDGHEAKDIPQVKAALGDLQRRGYRKAVVKAQIGASGIGMHKLDTAEPETADRLPAYLFYLGSVLVQGWLDETLPDTEYVGSPSVQLFVGSGTCIVYEITEQILSKESIHEGNISPPPAFDTHPEIRDSLLSQTEVAGSWLENQGYRGTASIDFHVVREKNKIRTRICEINARVTGATYPSVLAKHFLPDGAWLMRNICFTSPVRGEEIIESLNQKALLFKPGSNRGILPINFNMHEQHHVVKGQFLFLAGKLDAAYELLEAMHQTFSSHGAYDRD